MEKFLPDEVFPRKILVLNFNGTLVSKHVEFGKGVIVKLRPGIKEFINEFVKHYEIVIFSDDDTQSIMEMAQKINPNLQWVFGREFFSLHNNKMVKNLDYLNRNLSKIVVVDKSKDLVPLHIDNTLVIPEFIDDSSDNWLKKLTPLLHHLAKPEVRDIRKEIVKLGDNSVEDYYENLLKKYNSINRKSLFNYNRK